MTSELIDEYNDLESMFKLARDELPRLAADPAFREAESELKDLATSMSRERLLIGLLGRSQVGKSSTLNSWLEPAPGEEPATGGAGAPATCTATRLYRKTESQRGRFPAEKHLCYLRYMNAREYQGRIQSLQELLSYPSDLSEEALERALAAHVARNARQAGDRGEENPTDDIAADRRYLLRLLRAHQAHGSAKVRDDAVVERGRFADRASYTNHPAEELEHPGADMGAAIDPYPLLSSVEFAYEHNGLDDRVEAVDLPGLGARLKSDDLLTQAFLPDLAGAIIFQSAEQVASREAYDLLRALRGQYRGLANRIWMAITKMDILTDDHLRLGRSDSIFDNIARTMNDNGVSLDQVLLISNEMHKELRALGADPHPIALRTLRRGKTRADTDEAGDFILPEACRKYPELEAAYREVVKDGGIQRLREVIGKEMADRVQSQIRREMKDRIRSLRRELRELTEASRLTASLDSDQMASRQLWRSRLGGLIRKLDHDPNRTLLETPLDALIENLIQHFDKNVRPMEIVPKDLVHEHKTAVQVLRAQAEAVCRRETLPMAIRQVADEFAAIRADCGEVRLAKGGEPGKAWEEFSRVELMKLDWLRYQLAAFVGSPLFDDDSKSSALDASKYSRLMKLKIESVVASLLVKLGELIKNRLAVMRDELNLFHDSADLGDPDAIAAHDRVLAALDSGRASLSRDA